MTSFKVCIFCQSKGRMSREHVLPDWVHRLLPPVENKHYVTKGEVSFRDDPEVEVNQANTQRVLSRVCATCNNTWMSTLQGRAKPVLTEFIRGGWNLEDHRIADLISSWATMTSIVAATSAGYEVPAVDRAIFHAEQRPPAEWQIWIGMRSTSHPLHRVAYTPHQIGYQEVGGQPIWNYSFTAGIGQLIVYAARSTSELKFPRLHHIGWANSKGLFPVHPCGGEVLDWKQTPILFDHQFESLRHAYGRFVRRQTLLSNARYHFEHGFSQIAVELFAKAHLIEV